MFTNELTVMMNGKKLPLSQGIHALAATQHATQSARVNSPIQSDTSQSYSPLQSDTSVNSTHVSDTSHLSAEYESSNLSIESLIESLIETALATNNTAGNQDLRRPGGYMVFGGIG